MTKKIISILIPLLVSCSTLNQNAHSSLKEVCIDLLSVRVTIDMPVPIRIYKENYEEGIIYIYLFHDGIVLLHEGALMQFDKIKYFINLYYSFYPITRPIITIPYLPLSRG